MPFVSENRDGTFALHDTMEDAVSAALEGEPPAFWASPDGRAIIASPRACPDYTVAAHASIGDFLAAQADLDPDALAGVLRRFADVLAIYAGD